MTTACDGCNADLVAIVGNPPAGTDLTGSIVAQNNAVGIFVLVLAAVAVALRCYVRHMQGMRLAEDDYAVIVGLFFTMCLVASLVGAGRFGAGTHVWTMCVPDLIKVLKIEYAEPYIYGASVTSTKVGVLLLYRRLFSKGNIDRLYTTLFAFACFLTLIYPPILWIVMAVACKPLNYYWNQYIGAKGTCIDVTLFFLVLGIVNMVNDVIILLVPIPKIWKLQVSGRKKMSILAILLLGSFVCGASIARIYYLNRLAHATDSTWWMGPGFLWSSIEPSIGIVSACLPTFTPLLRHGRTKASTALSKSASHSHPNSTSGPQRSWGKGWRRTGSVTDENESAASAASAKSWGFGSVGRGLRLRPREDDEFQLTSRAQGGAGAGGVDSAEGSESEGGAAAAAQAAQAAQVRAGEAKGRILVQTKVEQSVDRDRGEV